MAERRLSCLENITAQVDGKAIVKSQSTKVFIVLFAALIVLCAFDGPGTEASTGSPPKAESAFCSSLDAGSVEVFLPDVLSFHTSPSEGVGSWPEVHPIRSLAQSIDHPPEKRA